ncbi:hypothetical protein [Cupriavidus sp. D39]|uniref:hypothetical protein n=1 Tax=Cupriavidus sp. D39 TaxID=2997877 RepID=UPI0022706676|nr:hypothetical protein [Cupriavidus sp. D39]MCY0852804.1 hypothetical protein [Cupriavidus sp. D39]
MKALVAYARGAAAAFGQDRGCSTSLGYEFTNYPDIDNMNRLIAPLSACKQQELLEQEQESGPRFD